MSFAIELLAAEVTKDGVRLGCITIGRFTERFACYPVFGTIEDLELQWMESLRKLVEGSASAVALIHDPRFAWIIYREGNHCFVQ